MFNTQFWKQAAERVMKGFAVAFLGAAFVGSTGPVNAFHINWGEAAGVGLGGAVLSLLMSLVSLPVGEPNSPSAVRLQPPAAANPEGWRTTINDGQVTVHDSRSGDVVWSGRLEDAAGEPNLSAARESARAIDRLIDRKIARRQP